MFSVGEICQVHKMQLSAAGNTRGPLYSEDGFPVHRGPYQNTYNGKDKAEMEAKVKAALNKLNDSLRANGIQGAWFFSSKVKDLDPKSAECVSATAKTAAVVPTQKPTAESAEGASTFTDLKECAVLGGMGPRGLGALAMIHYCHQEL